MSSEISLIEKLQRIERLYEGAITEGERLAAEEALQRIGERLRKIQQKDPVVEYKFTFPDFWRRRLFVALLRRYGFRPYRYRGQRHTTVMTRISKSFVDQTLWPVFLDLSEALVSHLDEITTRIIQQAVYSDALRPAFLCGNFGRISNTSMTSGKILIRIFKKLQTFSFFFLM